MTPDPSFDVRAPSDTASDVLLVGLSNVGMAGLTTTDYLVQNLAAEEVGYVTTTDFPAVTPFAEGRPRHHTRLYDLPDANLSVLMGELFLPVWASEAFVSGVLEWLDGTDFEEVVLLNGVPYPHAPDEHRVYHVATEAFAEHRLVDGEYDPLAGGFLDGVPGELLVRSMDGELPPTGVLVTPTHPPGPDLDASILFLDALRSLYDVEIDASELRQRSDELKQYYAELADRMQTSEERARFSEDRAYM
jgi:uncharacterized protein